MSADFPNRADWLKRRNTSEAPKGTFRCVAVRPVQLDDGRSILAKVQGTYNPGRNRVKRYVGTGKQRRKARKAMQREARAKAAEKVKEAA